MDEIEKILRQLEKERAGLKPCPYCRGKVRMREFAGWYSVQCYKTDCFASGPQRSTREEAMEAWNGGDKQQPEKERAGLNPCPYCRREVRIREFAGWYYVQCLAFECFASGPQRSTREEAMEAWNER